MRLVITGGTGNIGTALLRRLADAPAGSYDIVGIARRRPPATPPYDQAEWHSLDLADAQSGRSLALLARGADAVVHLAWGFQPSHDIEYLRRLGVDGSRRVALAAAEAGVPHLVHMSSVGAYSAARDDVPVAEDYPREGVPASPYSLHKAAAEVFLDGLSADYPGLVVTRFRPGFVVQRDAASGLLRYGLPAFVPGRAVRLARLLPLDRSLRIPLIHADDVASAIEAALRLRVGGAFNLAADSPIRRADIASALRARAVHVPARALSAVAGLAWRARLQPLDSSWIDLAFAVPLLDTARARSVLGWSPEIAAQDALRDVIDAMADGAHTGSPPLAQRSLPAQLRKLVTRGPIGNRRIP